MSINFVKKWQQANEETRIVNNEEIACETNLR